MKDPMPDMLLPPCRTLLALPNEILCEIMKQFPDTASLENLFLCNSRFIRVFNGNEQGICMQILERELGSELLTEAFKLLILQTDLAREAADYADFYAGRVLPVVANGTNRVGLAQARYILWTWEKCKVHRTQFCANMLQFLEAIGPDAQYPRRRNSGEQALTRVQRVRIDRAFYRYWCILSSHFRHLVRMQRGGTWRYLDFAGIEPLPAELCPYPGDRDELEEIYEFATLSWEMVDLLGANNVGGPRKWARKELSCFQRAVNESIREKLLAVGASSSLRMVREWDVSFDSREDQVASQCGGWGDS